MENEKNEQAKEQIINTEAAKAAAKEGVDKAKAAAGNFSNKLKTDKKVLGITVVVVVAVVLLILCGVVFGGGPAKTVKGYAKAYVKCDSKKVIKYMAPDIVKYMNEQLEDSDYLDYDNMTEYFEETVCEERDDDDIKYKEFKITKKEKMDKDDLEDLADSLEDTYDVKAKKVKAAYEFKVKYKVDKDGDDDKEKETITVAKIGSHWYVVG